MTSQRRVAAFQVSVDNLPRYSYQPRARLRLSWDKNEANIHSMKIDEQWEC